MHQFEVAIQFIHKYNLDSSHGCCTELTSWETLHPCIEEAPYLNFFVDLSMDIFSVFGTERYTPILKGG